MASKIGKTMVIKRRGHFETYGERKVYASCYYACKNAHHHEKDCKSMANKVSKVITSYVRRKSKIGRVTSTQIFKMIAKELRKHDEDAAFLYATHRDIS